MKPLTAGLVLLLSSPPLPAQQPEISVTQRVDVVVRRVTAVITDAHGKPLATPPRPDQLELFEDGQRCEILGVEPAVTHVTPNGEEPAAVPGVPSAAPAAEPSRPKPRRQAIYVDAGFLRVHSVAEVAQAFSAEADRLVALGPVEVVVADPRPQTVLPGTRDAAAVRSALAEIARKVPGRDRVLAVRRQTRDLGEGTAAVDAMRGSRMRGPVTGSGLSRMGAREEETVIRSGLDGLARWATSAPVPAEGILYFASDGFDVDLGEYYSEANPFAVRTEVVPSLLTSLRRAEQALLAGGWTTVSFAVGAAASGFTEAAEFTGTGHVQHLGTEPGRTNTFAQHPLDPLRTFADATGGAVLVSSDQLPEELSRLEGAFVVSFRVSRLPDGRLHALTLRSTEPGVTVAAVRAIPVGTPAAAATSRVLDLLEEPPHAGPLPVALHFTAPKDEGKGRRGATMEVKVSLAELNPVLARVGRGRMRVSVAVEVPGDVPFVTHEERALPKKPVPGWIFEAPVVWPKGAKRLAVSVEELATGTVGNATVDLAALR